MIKHPAFMVVIGALAGGLDAVTEMVSHFEKGVDVAYCIVLHLFRKGIDDFVVHRLKQATDMPCQMAVNGGTIKTGNIYIARPNQHLLVK